MSIATPYRVAFKSDIVLSPTASIEMGDIIRRVLCTYLFLVQGGIVSTGLVLACGTNSDGTDGESTLDLIRKSDNKISEVWGEKIVRIRSEAGITAFRDEWADLVQKLRDMKYCEFQECPV